MDVRKVLPRTASRTLMVTVLLLVSLCAVQTICWLFLFAQAPIAGAALMILFWPLLGFGLWRFNRAARGVVVALLWLAIVVLIVGVFNPFTAGDLMAERGEAPGVWTLVAWVGPVVALCLAVLHVLGKHKAEFGRSAKGSEENSSPGLGV